MFKIFNSNGRYTEYLCDYISDISTLPTSKHKGTASYGGDDLKNCCSTGSMAYCLENSALYTLGIETDEWHVQSSSSEVNINLTDYAKLTDIPTKTSQLDNDSNFLTEETQPDWNESDKKSSSYIKNKPTSMPASDVKGWAKKDTKPTYTADEVGALSKDTKISDLSFEDDINGVQYTIGIESGLIYLQQK